MNEISNTDNILATIIFVVSVIILFALSCMGCAHLGIADKEAMMNKWRGQPVTENLLADINEYANWYAKGDPTEERGKCVDQAELKLAILKELGIPAKTGHCTITHDPYHPVGHRFVIAQLDGVDYILDNGAVQNCVWEYEAVKRSTWGVINYEVEE